MKISVNWLKKFVPELPEIEELTTLIGARLVEIEEVENLGEKYKDVIVAKVVSAKKVEGSDHLSLCLIDDGGVRESVKRDKSGLVQVVCGAPNVRAGIFVAWLPPEAVVPETFGGEEFKLDARKLMGNMSNGMIASLRELDLGDEHDGILEMSAELFGEKLKIGASFADLYELNDYILEVENKSLTHRPDAFGIIGFAREVSGILGQKFATPNWMVGNGSGNGSANVKINIENSELCEDYQVAILDVEDVINSSEMTLEKTYLLRSGMRPIGTIVDLTNYLMLLSGQPLHAFDYDKLLHVSGDENTAEITVRSAKDGEKLLLLDSREIEMKQGDIVIAAGANGGEAIGLGGAMGGQSTEIDENTKRIIVESATFNLYNLRNTQMRHGIFSEAITRFTKGQPSSIARPVLSEFADRLIGAGAKLDGEITGVDNVGQNPIEITIEFVKINAILGTDYSHQQIIATLENVGFVCKEQNAQLKITAPTWRTDIHIEEDVAEEVGRLNGYDNIVLSLPKRKFEAVEPVKIDKLQQEIRGILASGGANEILSYSFVHGDLLKTVGQNPSNSYKIINSISPDLQYYRQSLVPSLLTKINQNIRASFDEFMLFEFNKITHKALGQNKENVPIEHKNLAAVYAVKKGKDTFYAVKKQLEFMLAKLNIKAEFVDFELDSDNIYALFEPKRSGLVTTEVNGQKINLGVIGEFRKAVQKSLKLPEATAGFEINIDRLLLAKGDKVKLFESISKFQAVERDMSVRLAKSTKFTEIEQLFGGKIGEFASENIKVKLMPLDIYSGNTETKNVTLRFKISPMDKTLSGDEIHEIMGEFEKLVSKINAEIV